MTSKSAFIESAETILISPGWETSVSFWGGGGWEADGIGEGGGVFSSILIIRWGI